MFNQKKYINNIYKNVIVPLENEPSHKNSENIIRYISKNFPLHLAIHKVETCKAYEVYTELHTHDEDEINIIIGNEELEYSIQLEEEIYTVKPITSVWIPRGIKHAANVVKGQGYFIAIRLGNKNC